MSLYSRVQYQSGHSSALQTKFPAILVGAATRTVLVVSLIILIVGYIFQVSSLTTGGYEIAKLQEQTAQLSSENEKLRSEIASYQSMSSVEKRLETLGMVKANNVQYIDLNDSIVAKR
ncbi:MAG: FtsL-like putative cell division protein [Patescibacteria group bacterium]